MANPPRKPGPRHPRASAPRGPGRPPHPDARRPAAAAPRGNRQNMIWGFHSVLEALRVSSHRIEKLFATPAAAARLADELAAASITPAIVAAEAFDTVAPPGAVHQGLAARVKPPTAPDLSELPRDGVVLVLDQVTDPHNVGAIIRTAAAFAVTAIVTTDRHAPPLDGVVAKAASGGLEHVPVVRVVNLARALEELGRLGFWRIGLDSDGQALLATDAPVPLALVLGAEGQGLRRLTRENCDAVARLALPGPIRSLNVSNACAVALAMLQPAMRAGNG